MDRMVINMLILSAFALPYRNHRRDWKSRLLEQCGNPRRWGAVMGITLLGVFLSAVAQAATFTVNSPFDVSDANPGNRVCETAPGSGVCTLRAAIEEANAQPDADEIILPPNLYLLTQVNELFITRNLTITGSGASTTII